MFVYEANEIKWPGIEGTHPCTGGELGLHGDWPPCATVPGSIPPLAGANYCLDPTQLRTLSEKAQEFQ